LHDDSVQDGKRGVAALADLRVETLVLRLGWRLQWREDGRWRCVNAGQLDAEASGELTPDEHDWRIWTGQAGAYLGGAELSEGGGEPTWWLLYGEMPRVGDVRIHRPDGTLIPVRTLGRVWACEWHGVRQAVTVEIGDSSHVYDFPVRHYLT